MTAVATAHASLNRAKDAWPMVVVGLAFGADGDFTDGGLLMGGGVDPLHVFV